MKLEDNLRQIEKRIAELQRKADWIKSQLTPPAKPIPDAVVEAVEQAEEVLIEQPRRRGRRKLNETE